MKDLGMNPSRKSTHYLITMTTFAHHSLAETWNFVAFVTGTQVFTCAMNFKLCQIYWKKKNIEKHFPSYRKLCWYKMCHSAFPFSPQSLHAGRGSPHLQCLVLLSQKELCKESHCCKNSAQRRNKNKTITCAQPHSPGQLFPSKVEEIGDKAWEKLLSPRRTYWAHSRVCNPQLFQLFLIFPLWEAAQHLQPAPGTAQGKCSHRLHSSEQSGSSHEWNSKGYGIIPD